MIYFQGLITIVKGKQSANSQAINPHGTKSKVLNMAPLYLGDDMRTFANPLSYLGGPRLPPQNRTSIESVLSLD
ncbi:hypothetical protein PV327_006677 [Microctonus hyperodae]|uniref:Uncharacterized protein n=1 Tax=Microctonus hyperodae TaxID=165561 RepID=A0AA39F4S8_MICHY|nr:hypothetical protein PV327_006677 [Microctonus hyperodae]